MVSWLPTKTLCLIQNLGFILKLVLSIHTLILLLFTIKSHIKHSFNNIAFRYSGTAFHASIVLAVDSRKGNIRANAFRISATSDYIILYYIGISILMNIILSIYQ